MTLQEGVCNRCDKQKETPINPILFSKENDMDPGEQPPELQNLTPLEQMLIAKAAVIVPVHIMTGGWTGYSGHTIIFPQDIQALATSLPRSPASLEIITIRRKNQEGGWNHFHVRRNKVLLALQFLIAHNPLYSDITLDEEVLQSLPEDGIVQAGLVAEMELDENEQAPPANPAGDLAEEQLQSVTLAPIQLPGTTEEEAVRQLLWPRVDAAPIPENAASLLTMIFPHLFPWGKGDITRPGRLIKINSNADYFQHLIRFHDGRFAADPRFRFYAADLLRRNLANKVGSFYARAQLSQTPTVQTLRKEVRQRGFDSVASGILRYSSNMRGGPAFWSARRTELNAMVDQLGPPFIFFTLSAADSYWFDLSTLLECEHTQLEGGKRWQTSLNYWFNSLTRR